MVYTVFVMPSPHAAKASRTPDDRIRFITDHGKQILFVDFSHCSAATVEEIVRKVPDVVATQPPHSVLIVADFTGAEFNADASRAMKEAAVFDKPYVKKTAWFGADDIPFEFRRDLSRYSLREFPSFKSREEALAWLVKE
jgi:hypothetical protein